MNLSELNELSLEDIGSWPLAVRAGVIAILCAALIGLAYYLFFSDKQAQLEQLQAKEETLKQEVSRKASKAAHLDALKAQLDEMERNFGHLSRQLPEQKEIASLLREVSEAGQHAGLEFELFQPQPELPKEDFYSELPIKVSVVGQYHEFGEFVEKVASLSRIVTLHDVSIKRDKEAGKLVMNATAKTYRLEEEEK